MRNQRLPYLKINACHIKAIAAPVRIVQFEGALANSKGGGERVELADRKERKGGRGSLSLNAELLSRSKNHCVHMIQCGRTSPAAMECEVATWHLSVKLTLF